MNSQFGEAASSEDCTPLNGTYQYYGEGTVVNSVGGGAHPEGSLLHKFGFNAMLSRAGVIGDVLGVQMTYSKEKQVYEIKILGKNLGGASLPSERAPGQTAMNYELPVSCENGRWKYHFHIEGAGEGVVSINDHAFYLAKKPDGGLLIHQEGNVTITNFFFFKKHRQASADYIFAPLK